MRWHGPTITDVDGRLVLDWPDDAPDTTEIHRAALVDLVARANGEHPDDGEAACKTCHGIGEVATTLALPGSALATTVTRYDICPECDGESEDVPTSPHTGHYVDCECWGCRW